jgi:protein O-mannosyl-transferase
MLQNVILDKNVFISIIVLVGLLAYSNSFSVPFQFDDDGYIVNNPIIRTFHYFFSPTEVDGLSPNSFPVALRYAFKTRIIGYVSLAINYKLHGLNVTGYHVVNLIIHIINAILVFLIIKATFKSDFFSKSIASDWPHGFIAAATALLFVSHPIQTQTVTYITQRFTSLAACFYLFSLVLYINARLSSSGFKRMVLIIIALLSTTAAMLTKEFTFTLPFVIILYEIAFFKGTARYRIKLLSPFIFTLSIIPTLIFNKQTTVSALDNTMRIITTADVTHITRIDYLLTQFRVIILYLRLLFIPINQNVDHDVTVYHSVLSFPVMSSFIVLLSLLTYAIYLYYKSYSQDKYPELRLASFGIIWFFISLSVESTIIPLGELVAEYRLYIPSIGMIMAVVSLIIYVTRMSSITWALRPTVMCSVCAFVTIVLSITTFTRNSVWSSEISLWEDAACKSPGLVRPHQSLSVLYCKQDRLVDAERELLTALALEPNNMQLHNNFGQILYKKSLFNEAISEYKIVLHRDPGNAMAHYNIGNTYLAQGRMREAIRELQIAVRLKPDYDVAYNSLGIALCQDGHSDLALNAFNQSLKINPQNENARRNIGICIKYTTQ